MTVLVLDASATVDLLIGSGPSAGIQAALQDHGHTVSTVAHLDAEVLSALSRLQRAGDLDDEGVAVRLDLLSDLDILRLPITGRLLTTAWSLRDTIAMRDALYVAAAMQLDGLVLTTDQRLRRASPSLTTNVS